ncbi:MAG: radical SAM protein, partial [Bacteroidales bacterium]|nr:radical SAM protein [Bacteroidales bacterium]
MPFCKTRCIYCDFYSTTLGGSRSKLFVEQVLNEAQARKQFLDEIPVKTLYLGGGTPSQLPSTHLCELVEGLHSIFDLSQLTEFTIEMNPEDVTPDYVAELPKAINRVSMGVQSFVDNELKVLHRRHNATKPHEAIRLLKAQGISNISIDLMYGLPNQTLESFAHSIDQA